MIRGAIRTGKIFNKLYNFANDVKDAGGFGSYLSNGISNLYRDSWLERVIDPTAVEMRFNAQEAEKSREWNSEQNRIAREVQIDLANTAVQRGVADAQKAGINPYLAYSGGGASVPSITSPTSSPASSAGGATSRFAINTLAHVANNVTKANIAANNNATKLAGVALSLLR